MTGDKRGFLRGVGAMRRQVTSLLLFLSWMVPAAKSLLSLACRHRGSHASTWRWGSPAVRPTLRSSILPASSQTRLKSRSATSELTVAREHLANLFADRNFLFTTRKNIREYEWGTLSRACSVASRAFLLIASTNKMLPQAKVISRISSKVYLPSLKRKLAPLSSTQ